MVVADRWKQLPLEFRAQYETAAAADKARYTAELQLYQQTEDMRQREVSARSFLLTRRRAPEGGGDSVFGGDQSHTCSRTKRQSSSHRGHHRTQSRRTTTPWQAPRTAMPARSR